MTATREELRDHLTAVIAAAQELPKEDRSYLADSFLDELETQYQLVPRVAGSRQKGGGRARRPFAGSFLGWPPLPVGLMFLLPLLLLPFFLLSFFVLVHVFFHPPVFLLVLALLLLFRFTRPRQRRGGGWQGPHRGNMSDSML